VKRQTLAAFANEMALGQFLLMGHGEAETGGRVRLATLCAAFEALVGAVYLDQGLDGVRRLVVPLIERELAEAQVAAEDKDPKSRLQELAQGIYGVTPRYRTVRAEGPDHAKVFTVQVSIGDQVRGEGEGPSKQSAAQEAAVDALKRQDDWPPSDPINGGPVLEP